MLFLFFSFLAFLLNTNVRFYSFVFYHLKTNPFVFKEYSFSLPFTFSMSVLLNLRSILGGKKKSSVMS